MLDAFYERNFSNSGLCNILRSLIFEAHLNLNGYRKIDANKQARLHHLTAVCNGIACYTLNAAVDYFESTPIETIERDKSFLERLSAYERAEETKLLNEVADLYEEMRRDEATARTQPVNYELLGGFEKSWIWLRCNMRWAKFSVPGFSLPGSVSSNLKTVFC